MVGKIRPDKILTLVEEFETFCRLEGGKEEAGLPVERRLREVETPVLGVAEGDGGGATRFVVVGVLVGFFAGLLTDFCTRFLTDFLPIAVAGDFLGGIFLAGVFLRGGVAAGDFVRDGSRGRDDDGGGGGVGL